MKKVSYEKVRKAAKRLDIPITEFILWLYVSEPDLEIIGVEGDE